MSGRVLRKIGFVDQCSRKSAPEICTLGPLSVWMNKDLCMCVTENFVIQENSDFWRKNNYRGVINQTITKAQLVILKAKFRTRMERLCSSLRTFSRVRGDHVLVVRLS